MDDLLYLECPCTSFPRSFARDFKESYLYPPPSTLYGFLLSLVGEEDISAHLGVRLAIGILGNDSPISRIVRKQRSHKFVVGGEVKKRVEKYGEGVYPTSQFSKPNFQELLTDVRIALKIDSSNEMASIKLSERVAIALSSPSQILRFGGLSLGESWAMMPDSARSSMISRSPNRKMLSNSCDTTTQVVPKSSRIRRINASISRAVTGSNPAPGSSKKTIEGSIARARAMPARFFMPPDSSAG